MNDPRLTALSDKIAEATGCRLGADRIAEIAAVVPRPLVETVVIDHPKHQHRKNRSYAAGARDALAQVNQIVGPVLEPRQRAALAALLQNIQSQDFPMPAPRGHEKRKVLHDRL